MIFTTVYLVTVFTLLLMLKLLSKEIEDTGACLDEVKTFTFIPFANTLLVVVLVFMLSYQSIRDVSITLVDKIIGGKE